ENWTECSVFVEGDVFCAGQTINLSGKIEGSARLAGQNVTLSGTVERGAAVAAQTLVVEKNSTILRDLAGAAQTVTIDGLIVRDFALAASNATISGQIGRDVTGEIKVLTIGSTGRIGGNLNYTSDTNPVISSGGQVVGKVTRAVPAHRQNQANTNSFAVAFWSLVYAFVAMLVAALALVLLVPRVFQRLSSTALSSPGRVGLTGLVGVVVVPSLIVLLFISAIGLPLAVLALLMWCLVVLLSGPFVAYTLGRLILKNQQKPILIMLAGASLLLIISFIPIIGLFVGLASYVFGTGMLLDESIRRLSSPVKKVTSPN
ncbi:MAG: hypothetical protein ABI716_03005, partial [Candidatus Saccharibacteria bacterium]